MQANGGRESMRRTGIALLVAVITGVPLGGIVAMLLTPVFWRLEPILHVELAGHSGPADWLILLLMAVTAIAIFFRVRRAPSLARG